MLTWDSFKPAKSESSGIAGLKERVSKRVLVEQAGTTLTAEPKPDFERPLVEEIATFTKESIRRVRLDNDQFPPIATVTRYPSAKARSVKLTFSNSDVHLMPGLSVVVCIDIVDAEARAVRASACAHTSAKPPAEFEKQVQFFSGIYDQSRFHAALEETLYKIVELVQSQSPEQGVWLQLDLQ